MKDKQDIFNKIYTEDLWSGGSGPGSLPENAKDWISYANKIIQSNDVFTILDLGCGDWQIGKCLNLSNKKYMGVDVSSVIIEKTKENSSDSISFICDDIENMDFPKVDLILIKDVLQHLPNSSVSKIMNKVIANSKYALICNDCKPHDMINSDIEPGDWRPLDLSDKPFSYDIQDLKIFQSKDAVKKISLYINKDFNK